MKTLFFIFIACFLSSFLYSTIINVPTPYATIQSGITAAVNTDTVLVQPGTYVENINYNGKLITVGSLFLITQDTSYISQTIIDGNGSGSVVTCISGENSSSFLCGFTITNGQGSGSSPDYDGGGITCRNSSSPRLENLIVTGNSGSWGGGLFCHGYSNPIIKNATFSNNDATSGGGICCLNNTSPDLQNVTISDNTASYGGGMTCYPSTCHPSLQNVLITGNHANVQGGGIGCEGAVLNLENVTITGNSAINNAGGITCESNSIINITNSIFWNNSLEEINITLGSVTVNYSDIEGGWAGTGNIDVDPLFTGSSDFHLSESSPCIDAGDPVSPLDPDGTRADMGAFYFNQYNGPIWNVSTTGSDITGIGAEAYPFATIQHGINTASDTDTVLVQPGTYYENVNFAGRLITVGSLFLTTQDTTYISSTVIDGSNSGIVVEFENGEDESAILTGFTITNGYTAHGGGVRCGNSSPRLENLIITNNSVINFGGGIYCGYSSPNIKNVVIANNHAVMYGGGIATWYSDPVLTNVTISGNTADDYADGIYCAWNSSLIFKNSIVWNNSPDDIYIVTSGVVSATYSDIPGITGVGNFIANPLISVNFHLTVASPCIDTGDPVYALDPDGTRGDMGAFYFHQVTPLDPPQNVAVEIIGSEVHITWDAVTCASSYKVFSSDDPDTGFVEDTSGTFAGTSWYTSVINEKKFYKIVASDQP